MNSQPFPLPTTSFVHCYALINSASSSSPINLALLSITKHQTFPSSTPPHLSLYVKSKGNTHTMANFPTKLLTVLLAAVLASSLMISARKLESKSSLLARLKLAEEGPSTCWDALLELQSCSGEVVMFFMNGEAHLGANCCSAMRVIEHQCWPSMLSTLGITAQESNVLRGYCDSAASADTGATTTTAAPPPASTLHQCYNLPRLHQ